MMALATREDLSLFDDVEHLWRKERLWRIRNPNDYKLFTFHFSLLISIGRDLVLVVLHRRR